MEATSFDSGDCCGISSLLHELVELRSDISKLLRSDVEEQKLRLGEAQSTSSSSHISPSTTDMESDLLDWLSDIADADTIQKVSSRPAAVTCMSFYSLRLVTNS